MWEKYCLRPLNKMMRKSGSLGAKYKKNEEWHKILEITVDVSYYLIVWLYCCYSKHHQRTLVILLVMLAFRSVFLHA